MADIQKAKDEFINTIESLKDGRRLSNDGEENDLVNASYQQGISDVLTLLEGGFKKEIQQGTSLKSLLEKVAREQNYSDYKYSFKNLTAITCGKASIKDNQLVTNDLTFNED